MFSLQPLTSLKLTVLCNVVFLCKFDVGCKLFSFVIVAVFQNECIFFGSEAKSRHGGDEAKYN